MLTKYLPYILFIVFLLFTIIIGYLIYISVNSEEDKPKNIDSSNNDKICMSVDEFNKLKQPTIA